jgi:hypothetical protein
MRARHRVMQALPYQGIYCHAPGTQFGGPHSRECRKYVPMPCGNRVAQVLRYLSSLFTYLTNIVLHEVWYRDVPPCIKMLLIVVFFQVKLKPLPTGEKKLCVEI